MVQHWITAKCYYGAFLSEEQIWHIIHFYSQHYDHICEFNLTNQDDCCYILEKMFGEPFSFTFYEPSEENQLQGGVVSLESAFTLWTELITTMDESSGHAIVHSPVTEEQTILSEQEKNDIRKRLLSFHISSFSWHMVLEVL